MNFDNCPFANSYMVVEVRMEPTLGEGDTGQGPFDTSNVLFLILGGRHVGF